MDPNEKFSLVVLAYSLTECTSFAIAAALKIRPLWTKIDRFMKLIVLLVFVAMGFELVSAVFVCAGNFKY